MDRVRQRDIWRAMPPPRRNQQPKTVHAGFGALKLAHHWRDTVVELTLVVRITAKQIMKLAQSLMVILLLLV
jgi:hypothetical protein